MKISIVTTAYNSEKFISQTIESVIYQRGDFQIEYFLIDALSSDRTLGIMEEYKKLVDSGFFAGRNNGIEIKIISEKDNGMYEGISKGLRLCTGDVVAYINSDDFYLPGAFSCITDVFTSYPEMKWCVGRINSYNEQDHNTANFFQYYWQQLIPTGYYGTKSDFIQQESCFWRRELLEHIDYDIFCSFKYAGDYYLWREFSKTAPLISIDSVLSGFRFSDTQKTSVIERYYDEFNSVSENIKFSLRQKLVSGELHWDRKEKKWSMKTLRATWFKFLIRSIVVGLKRKFF